MKKNFVYIIISVLVIILAFVILLIYRKTNMLANIENNEVVNNKTDIITDVNDCVLKGNECTLQEMFDGVKLTYEVNEKEKYNFYVISNNEERMTLLMDSNLLDKINWHDELMNLKGPLAIMLNYMVECADWSNVPDITNYQYNDYGKISYYENCKAGFVPDGYNCDDYENSNYGYQKIDFNGDGQGYVLFGFGEDRTWDFDNHIKARAITVEEYNSLVINGKYPSWLIDNLQKNEGYWTLSSSVTPKTAYSGGAYAVVNLDGAVSLETAYVMHEYEKNFNVGIRPVITVFKRN